MKIIQQSWSQELLFGIDSIVLRDGTAFQINIDSIIDTRAKETFNRIYTLSILEKTSIEALLLGDADLWSEIQVYGEIEVSNNSRILFGEGGMGNEGFIAKVNSNNSLDWSFFSTQSNPFIEYKKVEGEIQLFSSHGFGIILKDVNDPLKMSVKESESRRMMDYQKDIDAALKEANPTEALRNFAILLSEKGAEKEKIYEILYSYSLELYEERRNADAEILEDVMDMVTGWYVGRNI